MTTQKGFAKCRKCDNWSYIPEEFNESKQLVQCPTCKIPMTLARGLDPIKDLAYPAKDEVKAGTMSQKGY